MTPATYAKQNGFACTPEFEAGWHAHECVAIMMREKALQMMNRMIAHQMANPSADDFECCGNPVVGAQYMGQNEMICCGDPNRKDG